MDQPPQNTEFWIALLSIENRERRAHLWNGYLGSWLPSRVQTKPDSSDRERHRNHQKNLDRVMAGLPPVDGWGLFVEPPDGGWPELTHEEVRYLEELANSSGGHPELLQYNGFDVGYMNFQGYEFTKRKQLDLSELTVVGGNFRGLIFPSSGRTRFVRTRFFGLQQFARAEFKSPVDFVEARFADVVDFTEARFSDSLGFHRAVFEDRAMFDRAVFHGGASFGDAKFSASPRQFYSYDRDMKLVEAHRMGCLVSFVDVEFHRFAAFSGVQFGGESTPAGEPHRWVDFSGAKFGGHTTFGGASFAGPPAFFETTLHKDTDFHDVTWRDPARPYTSYNIRAWEQLELIMSELEKPRDRHRFFRKRMRAMRHRPGNHLLRALNWLFEKTADYGWGAKQAARSWLIHWLGGALILLLATCPSPDSFPRLLFATIATSFSNAHAFLGLTSENGYLATYRDETTEAAASSFQWVVQLVGTGQAVLGPILLFLLLLTLRNRFRLG